jgi:hypothetical protein
MSDDLRALKIAEKVDTQGTVVGVRRVVDWPPRQSTPFALQYLCLAAVALLAEISAERAEKAATPGGLGNVP